MSPTSTPFFDAFKAYRDWLTAGRGSAGYQTMINRIKKFKAAQPKAFAKGGKVTVKKLSKPKLSRPVSAFGKGGKVTVRPKRGKR